MTQAALLARCRSRFHERLLERLLIKDSKGIPSNADGDNKASVAIATKLGEKLGGGNEGSRLGVQESGVEFETHCRDFLRSTFLSLSHLRPGTWQISRVGSEEGKKLTIASFEQYRHLIDLELAAKDSPALAAILGSDYTVRPDVIIARSPEPDEVINKPLEVVDSQYARHTSLRSANEGALLLHASISCKWTIRSDRAQNARTEALNLVRYRKGHLPHVVVVTGEPLPSRLSSIALGTGDLDCVYHFALHELQSSLDELDYPDASDQLKIMVDGKRLRDISDLPLDLAV